MDFWDRINNGETYLCDRCNVVELRFDEFRFNWNAPYHYCDECWNWIHLQKWTDKNGNHHTLRSERKVSSLYL